MSVLNYENIIVTAWIETRQSLRSGVIDGLKAILLTAAKLAETDECIDPKYFIEGCLTIIGRMRSTIHAQLVDSRSELESLYVKIHKSFPIGDDGNAVKNYEIIDIVNSVRKQYDDEILKHEAAAKKYYPFQFDKARPINTVCFDMSALFVRIHGTMNGDAVFAILDNAEIGVLWLAVMKVSDCFKVKKQELTQDKNTDVSVRHEIDKLKEYFVPAFKGMGNGGIDYFNMMKKELQKDRTAKEIAQIAFHAYNGGKLNSRKPQTFREWHRLFCDSTGCKYVKYEPNKLKNPPCALKALFSYLE